MGEPLVMALHLVMQKFTVEGIKAIQAVGYAARIDESSSGMRAAGLEPIGMWFDETGEWDLIGLVRTPDDFPDGRAVVNRLLAIGSGAVALLSTRRLYEGSELDAAGPTAAYSAERGWHRT